MYNVIKLKTNLNKIILDRIRCELIIIIAQVEIYCMRFLIGGFFPVVFELRIRMEYRKKYIMTNCQNCVGLILEMK